MQNDLAPAAVHQMRRVRYERKRRVLTVAEVERLTPRMTRVRLKGDLADFCSAGFDDHIRVLFPSTDGDGEAGRDFTPRAFDVDHGVLTLDFALHEAGPATEWAFSVSPGQTLQIGGPRGSVVIPDDFNWLWLIGDETALPAIGRAIEEARPGFPVASLAIVADLQETQTFETKADWRPHWVLRDSLSRDGRGDAAALRDALDGLGRPPGDGFIWIAAEADVARALRSHLIENLGHPKAWIKAAGYWQRGGVGAHQRIED